MQDTRTKLQVEVDELARQLSASEAELADAKKRYQIADQESPITGILPSDKKWLTASQKVDQLRRQLAELRERLTRESSEERSAERLAAIRGSGSPLASMVAVGEAKLARFAAAAAALRQAEADLYAVLFDEKVGLKQHFHDPQAQKDAAFARDRLRGLAIRAARQAQCRINARFETDGNVHLGEPEQSVFYAAAK